MLDSSRAAQAVLAVRAVSVQTVVPAVRAQQAGGCSARAVLAAAAERA
jgi:hypothetical protein